MLRTIVLLLAVSLGPPGVSTQALTVSAAVSLTEVLEAIAGAYTAAGGDRVIFNFGASNVLARQIANGAPVDVFISADDAQMDLVSKAGMIEDKSRMPIVQNQLAVITRRDWAGEMTSTASLSTPTIRRIAVGDPTAVPAGIYAKQYLERVGLWASLQQKLLPAASVRAALAAVANGAADAGIVYSTDARTSKEVRLAFTIDGRDAPHILYPGCIIRTSARKDAARKFLNFLTSPEGARIFRDHGFLPVTQDR